MKFNWKKLFAAFKSDRGDSILVMALILSSVVALAAGLMIEVQKNSYIRNDRINSIQDAASSAVSLTDSRGSLNWSVVDRVVNEYEHNRFGKKMFSSTANSRLRYDDAVRETSGSRALENDNTGKDNSCLVDRKDNTKYPYYKITLETGRGDNNAKAPTVSFSRKQPSLQSLNTQAPLDRKTIYRSIRVEVIDQAPNMALGVINMPCQKFDLTANAVTFSANADLD